MGRFEGKVAVVTGAASGIGRALSEALAREGAKLVLADVQAAALDGFARELRARSGMAITHAFDVRDAAGWAELVARTRDAHGRIDYLFNNAGIAIVGEARDMSLADWDRIVDVNVRGVMYGVHAVYPTMIAQGSGHIVNTASVAGLVAAPSLAAYAMTKHAVVGLSVSLRAEADLYGVRVSALCPGFVKTGIFDAGTYVTGSRESELTANALRVATDPETCARRALDGVARNEAIIVVTGHAKLLRFLTRYASPVAALLARETARRIHAERRPDSPA